MPESQTETRAAHTPGPWRIEDGGAGEGESTRCEIFAGAVDDPFRVAVIDDSTRWLEPEKKRAAAALDLANARLIAASPDHAMVLRMMARGVLRWEPFRGGTDRGELCFSGIRHATDLDEFGCPRLTDHLRSAIAKAEGGAA